MNIIVLDKDYYLINNEEVNIDIKKKNITIEVEGNVKINDLTSKEDLNLKLVLKDNSNVIYNKYNKDLAYSNIDIDIKNNSSLSFNQSIYNTLEGNFKVNSNILGNNNKVVINFYGVSNNKGKIKAEATSSVKKDIKNNDVLENVRILALNDEENIIYPNLLVSSDDVIINHNATISGVNEDYLFYLESKGLDKEEATNLIYKGFITSKLILNEEEKEYIKW